MSTQMFDHSSPRSNHCILDMYSIFLHPLHARSSRDLHLGSSRTEHSHQSAVSAIFGLLAGTAAFFALLCTASAEEPTNTESNCELLSNHFDELESTCSTKHKPCSDLPPEDSRKREQRGQESADCASRYASFLDFAARCGFDIRNDENYFDTLTTTLDHWEQAHECTPNRDFLQRAIDRIDRETLSLSEEDPHRTPLLDRRTYFSTLKQPSLRPPPVDPFRTSAEDPSLRGSRRRSSVHAGLLEHFTLRFDAGFGQVLRLVPPKDATHHGDKGLAIRFSAGARFGLGAAQRHLIGFGLVYSALGSDLAPSEGADLENPVILPDQLLVWIHYLGAYARYSYRVHRDHFALYAEAGGGLQAFVAYDTGFGTPSFRAAGGACSLWQILCVDAGYIKGWGGPVHLGFANAWSVALGVDVLRIASTPRRTDRPSSR